MLNIEQDVCTMYTLVNLKRTVFTIVNTVYSEVIMFIRKPTAAFYKGAMDRAVFLLPELTDGAKVLYAYLFSHVDGANIDEGFLQSAMGLSQSAYARRKRELTGAGLLLVEQTSPRVYVCYLGVAGFKAKSIKTHWVTQLEDSV